MNIQEFEGFDADSWIQNIEQYFDAARTLMLARDDNGFLPFVCYPKWKVEM